MTEPDTNEFLLAAMRCGRMRISLLLNEIDQIGIALKGNMITHDGAVAWLDECGLLQFIDKIERKDAAA